MRAVDPEGRAWEVSRQWLHVPRWRVGRPRVEDVLNTPMGDGDDFLAGIAFLVAVVVVTFLFFLVGLPLLLLAAGVLFAVGGLGFRILFRRPWLVEARSGHRELRWRVRGTLGSRRAIHDLAAAIGRGDYTFEPHGAVREAPR